MHRPRNLRRAATAALAALTPFALQAQTEVAAERSIDRSLSWCTARAVKPEWARQPIMLVLEEDRDARGAELKSTPLPPSHLAELLGAVRKEFRAATRLAGTVDESGAELVAADSRYPVSALWGEIAFQLRGNGAIDSIVVRDVRDSTLFNQITAALRAGSIPGALTPFGKESDVRPMTLTTAMSASKTGATWAMFSMEVPRERPVTVVKRPSLSYPPEALNWNADITLEFYVDTAGKPEPRTIVTVPSAESIKWPDAQSQQVYRDFVAVSRRGVERTRFTPAEFLGCRRRQLVSQPLSFRPQPPL